MIRISCEKCNLDIGQVDNPETNFMAQALTLQKAHNPTCGQAGGNPVPVAPTTKTGPRIRSLGEALATARKISAKPITTTRITAPKTKPTAQQNWVVQCNTNMYGPMKDNEAAVRWLTFNHCIDYQHASFICSNGVNREDHGIETLNLVNV